MKKILFILFTLCCFSIATVLHGTEEKEQEIKKNTYDIGGHFKLIDQNGNVFDSKNANTPYLLVFFGYGSCKSTCPTALNELTIFMNKHKNLIKKIQPVFISLEPSVDTPEKLKTFGEKYNKDILMLTTTESNGEDYIKKLLTQYKAYSAKIKLNDKEKKAIGDDYVIEHTSFFYLIDKKTGNLIKPVASNKDSMEIDLQEYKR